ncbi:hypothetical protein [Taibaiella koreensis]|uniref:hypothetical protein n=1 Tax=Taibaiella koreensis TaxID=1268548 RepID=UPI000E59FC98|nr:hypothetical protein [Taibaiella koreensis]
MSKKKPDKNTSEIAEDIPKQPSDQDIAKIAAAFKGFRVVNALTENGYSIKYKKLNPTFFDTGTLIPEDIDDVPRVIVGPADSVCDDWKDWKLPHGISEQRPFFWNISTALPIDKVDVDIDRGTASDEQIADILSELSLLNRMMGGSGINFELTGIFNLENDEPCMK